MTLFEKCFPGLCMDPDTEREIEAAMPQYLFYEPHERRGNLKLCQCSACGGRGAFELEGKSKDAVECPMCRRKVTLIASNRLSNQAPSLRQWTSVIWFQADGPYLWAVGAKITREFERNSYDGPDWISWLEITPYEAYHFAPGTARMWKYKNIWDCRNGRWYACWNQETRPREPFAQGGPYNNGPYQYYLWQTDEIYKSTMKYCAVDLYMEDPIEDGSLTYGIIKYLTAYCERPKLELAVKWGLYDVANDLVWNRKTNGRMVNWNADTPWAFLKISKTDWNAYRKYSFSNLEILKFNKYYARLPLPELLEIILDLGGTGKWLETSAKLIKFYGIPLKRQIRYIGRQDGYSNRTWGAWLRLWEDYLRMATELGRDVTMAGGAMPRDLQAAHDEMVELQRAMREETLLKEHEKKKEEYQARKKQLEKKYAYQSGDLMICVPKDAGEIIREGNVLKICVGGYAGRHLEGKTAILFLRRRRKPDTPYICIEIDERTDTIRQIHGYRNEFLGHGKRIRPPEERFHQFLSEWLAWVKAGSKKQPTTKEASA